MRQFVMLLLAATAFSQDTGQQQLMSAPYEDAEAYKVYSALLPRSDYPLLIRKDTIGEKSCVSSVRAADKSAASALDDYEKVNSTSWTLRDKFTLPKVPRLVSTDDLRAMDAEDRKTGRVEPGSSQTRPHFILSAVGFNPDKTIAVVWIYYTCGGLCGNGHLAVLRKADGVWKETNEGNACVIVS